MTIKKAKQLLEEEFERAKRLEYVKNPLAYALYQVWKKADAEGAKMEKEKQIEEMGKQIYGNFGLSMPTARNIATYLTNKKGYRKASDVAEEIFAEIEKEIEAALASNYRAKNEHYNHYNHYNHSVIPNYDNFYAMCDGKIYAMRGLLDFITELKKKYTEGKK